MHKKLSYQSILKHFIQFAFFSRNKRSSLENFKNKKYLKGYNSVTMPTICTTNLVMIIPVKVNWNFTSYFGDVVQTCFVNVRQAEGRTDRRTVRWLRSVDDCMDVLSVFSDVCPTDNAEYCTKGGYLKHKDITTHKENIEI